MKKVKMGMVRRGVIFLEEKREWKLTSLLYGDNLVLCGESQDDLRAMVRHFGEVCWRRSLKVNASRSKVMVMNGEEGLEFEIHVDGMRLEYVSEFKYLVCF